MGSRVFKTFIVTCSLILNIYLIYIYVLNSFIFINQVLITISRSTVINKHIPKWQIMSMSFLLLLFLFLSLFVCSYVCFGLFVCLFVCLFYFLLLIYFFLLCFSFVLFVFVCLFFVFFVCVFFSFLLNLKIQKIPITCNDMV